MDKIKVEIDRTFFFSVMVTIAVNLFCMVLQYISFLRMREMEEIYRDLLWDERRIKADKAKNEAALQKRRG